MKIDNKSNLNHVQELSLSIGYRSSFSAAIALPTGIVRETHEKIE